MHSWDNCGDIVVGILQMSIVLACELQLAAWLAVLLWWCEFIDGCMYGWMCVCMCMCMCVCVCIYVCIYIYILLHLYSSGQRTLYINIYIYHTYLDIYRVDI